ncbi:hypothetical protein ASPWEDRAFT_42214 [Aspergillus wentii DTO 134E9]|uniref:FAD/NAD(P)-binding domain-containing protein n=1 Tax=Aspergillus wentii DTO 134E9 TaxID=1073089 RepID=A0A1L9RH66_ASPWE|nr:uncharacterized protein ASPWEDRAFT_42214 [Aspergillus wentii DTO 134E9]KAI9928039.1 hypothetical protein MW887_002891 [Aspergillus wentii]OJJ34265.1 hypothetical protein ASPWEDRAFT_42214 [Aspergillus wentii DTO 134E9]
MTRTEESIDVIIVGAGLAGINTAYRIQTELPHLRYSILEARGSLGGTWDLFRYPGIRSDSDFYTLGFSWYPWTGQPIAGGASIHQYMKEAAAVSGVDQHILYHHKLAVADWSDQTQSWSLEVDCSNSDSSSPKKLVTARYLVFATGYYDYDTPLEARIPGLEKFQGQVIHPQFWPEDLDYTGKKIVVVGSGATAITLIPSLSKKASQVTMLQRSPGYVLRTHNRDRFPLMPYWFKRLWWILITQLIYFVCKCMPNMTKRLFYRQMERQLPQNIPSDPHFKPRYNPWDQRLCVCPDGDFYTSLRAGKANVKTSTIKTVTPTSILLNSTESLEADIIVTATGLKIRFVGGTTILINGEPCNPADRFMWKGAMLQNIPNLFNVIGYPNASWTLGADLTASMICQIYQHMERSKRTVVVPRMSTNDSAVIQTRPFFSLSSTYLTVASRELPKTGNLRSWAPRQYYLSDLFHVRFGRLFQNLEFAGDVSFQKPHVE